MKIKFNMAGFAEARTAPAVMARLNDYAAQVAASAGRGYRANPAQVTGGRRRGRASVGTDIEGARRESKDHYLANRTRGV